MRCQYWLKQQNMESLKEFRGDFRELLKLGKETIYSKINSFEQTFLVLLELFPECFNANCRKPVFAGHFHAGTGILPFNPFCLDPYYFKVYR